MPRPLQVELSTFRTAMPLSAWLSVPLAFLVTKGYMAPPPVLAALMLSTIGFWAGEALTGAGHRGSRFARTWPISMAPVGHRSWGHCALVGPGVAGLLCLANEHAPAWSFVLLAGLFAPVLNGWTKSDGWPLAVAVCASCPLLGALQVHSPSWAAPCGLLVGFFGHLVIEAAHTTRKEHHAPPDRP